MTRARRWEDARWELLGAVVVCIAVLGLDATVDPSGWLWSVLVSSAPIVLGVTVVYAVVVFALYRSEASSRARASRSD